MINIKMFYGIEIDDSNSYSIKLLNKAINQSHTIRTAEDHRIDTSSSLILNLKTINSLFSSNYAKCTLKHPAEDIQMILDTSGDLVLRCYHSPCHEWDLNGSKR